MGTFHLSKQTSERSDRDNWIKAVLIKNSGYQFDSLEGCNQNAQHQITHLIERAFCENNLDGFSLENIHEAIIKLEGEQAFYNKIAFCKNFGLPLFYAIYGQKNSEFVKLFSIDEKRVLVHEFNSYKSFSDWIKTIKGWKSSSSFQHGNELPFFDQELRKHGTAWPTNIDCFVSKNNQPLAILEFQNAHKTPLARHENNNYFWGLTPKDDQRRWFSQEILRVRSGLPFVIVTWSKNEPGFILKKLEKCVFPNHADSRLKSLLRDFVRERENGRNKLKIRQLYDVICRDFSSEELFFDGNSVGVKVNQPPLSFENRTFPMLYYGEKIMETSGPEKLVEHFKKLVN